MNEPQNKIDDKLADFTDYLLSEENIKQDKKTFALDPELQALEETVLHLKNTFREDEPNKAVLTRIHKNILTQWQQEKDKKSERFWGKWIPSRQKWMPQRSRQRMTMISYAALVLGVFLVSIFLINGAYSDQPAATGQNLVVGFLVAVVGVIVFAISFFRHKR